MRRRRYQAILLSLFVVFSGTLVLSAYSTDSYLGRWFQWRQSDIEEMVIVRFGKETGDISWPRLFQTTVTAVIQ